MTKQEVEDKLFDFLVNKMISDNNSKIESVERFNGYLCTNDNGLVIDCADGTQIRLIIQVA